MSSHTILVAAVVVVGLLLIGALLFTAILSHAGAVGFIGATLVSMAVSGELAWVLVMPWYSPARLASVSTSMVHQLNEFRAPSGPDQIGNLLHQVITNENAGGGGTRSARRFGADSYTISLSGDTAHSCVTYHLASTRWSFVSGRCHSVPQS